MPKRRLSTRKDCFTAADSQVHDEPTNERLRRLERQQLPQAKSGQNGKAHEPSSCVESTVDSESLSCPSIAISPDATPLPSATDENDCRNDTDNVEETCQQDEMPTMELDDQCPVTLVFEKSPLHVAPRLHKERPDRIEWIRECLQNQGLLDQCHVLKHDGKSRNTDDGCCIGTLNSHKRHRAISHRDRVLNSIKKAHSAGLVNRMERLENFSGCLQEESHQYDSVYLTQHSWSSAKQSTSSLCKLVDHILSPQAQNHQPLSSAEPRTIPCGFACIRPPGHHASSSLAHGYCLINHVAVAAKFALEYHGCEDVSVDCRTNQEPFSQESLASQLRAQLVPAPQRRVAILDWDVHHGDGTQSIFWNDPNVLFCSIHAQKAFPFVPGSSAKSVGGPQALGKTVNVAWTSHDMGDEEYLYALQTLILPILQEFHPTLLLISAGFDAAAGDGFGGNLSPVNGFGRMTTEILKVTNKLRCPVVASLEGGYKQSVLGPCVTSVVQAMVDFHQDTNRMKQESGKTMLEEEGNKNLASHHDIARTCHVSTEGVCPTAVKNVEATREAQQKYWKCLSSGQ